mmetsp:Transcript_41231/g.67014  ORF Transcript_41231/g.67014 Transcript_41231/m.67014 type:complete len:764 (-) Transcript_41231:86-2377(-)
MSIYKFLDSVSGQVILKLEDVTIYKVANIGFVVFNMLDRPVNVMNLRLMPQFDRIFKVLETCVAQRQFGVIVFASGKNESFIAGADIDMLYPTTKAAEIEAMAAQGQAGFNKIGELGIPTIAAINGAALGAGCELALACTYRVCANHKKVQIGLPEVKLGLLPGSGGTSRLPRVVGLQEALKIILPGGDVRAKKALKIGLVDAVFPADEFKNQHAFWRHVMKFAEGKLWKSSRRVYKPNKSWGDWFLNSTYIGNWLVGREAVKGLDKMAKGKYPGPYFALDAALNSVGASQPAADRLEAKHFGKLGNSSQSKALISLFKMMEGAKKFAGKCGGATGISPKKIGIVGAGVMGSQIAVLCAKKGLKVYMRDIKQEVVAKGLALVKATFDRRVAKGRMAREKADARIALVKGGTEVSGFSDCDLVIEAAVELMSLKKKIFLELEKTVRPDCVIATNTSSLSITELASVLDNPERCVGIHFFNPVGKMPLVEVIKGGEKTSGDSIATGYRFALQLGKIPVICNDCPGFVVNRILGIYMGEAVKLAIEGCQLPYVDDALLDFGMPMGPFRLMDEVGLDVAAHVAPVLEEGLGERYASDPRYLELVKANPQWLGKKTAAGFYLYDKGGKGIQGGLNPGFKRKLDRLVKKSPRRLSKSMIADRCVFVMLNEACMVLEEGMIDQPEDLDLAMVMGTGFAPFSAGPLSYADFRGIDQCVARMRELAKKFGKRFEPHQMLVKMANEGTRFFPDRPNPKQVRQIPASECPRSKL